MDLQQDKICHCTLTLIFVYFFSKALFWSLNMFLALSIGLFIGLTIGFTRELIQSIKRVKASGRPIKYKWVKHYFDIGDMNANFLGAFIATPLYFIF
jgi:ABC-type nickel/cobalt efflux system permease component RcnA